MSNFLEQKSEPLDLESVNAIIREGRSRELLQTLPAAIYTTDAEGRITFFNDAAAELWGRKPEFGTNDWCGSWRLYWPEGRPMRYDQSPMAVALKENRAIRGTEAVAERPDGTRIPFLAYPTPLRDESGAVTGAINTLVDITESKHAERVSQRLGSIVEFSRDAIVGLDLKGIITTWNQGAERLFGYTEKEAIGNPVTFLSPPDRSDEAAGILGRIGRGEHLDHCETVRQRKDGSLVDVSLTVSPMQDANGTLAGAWGIAEDITAEVQSRAAIAESEERYRTLFASAPIAIFVCDRKAVIQHYNHRAVELWGREPVCGVEQHCGSVKLWLPNGTLLPHALSPMVEVLRTGIPARNVEVFIERPDGSRLPVLVNFAPLKNTEGEVIGAITSFVDITDRKQTERARRDAEEQFQVLADNIPALCWMADASGWIHWYNRRWYEYTGTTPESQEGWGWESVHDPKELPGVLERYKASVASGEPFEMVFPLKGADGAFRPFLTRIVPHRDADGCIVRWFGTNTDISAEREAAARQQLLVDELNHRVKNTLATVQSIAAQLLKRTSDVELRETFDGRLVALSRTHDLLVRDSWEAAPLRDLLLQEFEPYRSEEGTRFVVEGPDLRLNPKAALTLGMAFHELTTNAAKYGALSKPAGQVRVTWDVPRASEHRALRLKWVETGGPPVKKREHKGFGSTLIERGLSLELEGEVRVDFDPRGLICTMEIPLAAAGGEENK
ncbi:MAG: PAS domain S-box protein [Pseudomonadota bacterium]|nr:PAS domain S-box protein [Pseudomonadota bacterium]